MIGLLGIVALLSSMHSVSPEGHNDTAMATGSEHELRKTLFQDYNSNIMPRTNTSGPIVVMLGLNLMSIDQVDEKRQTIGIRAFLDITWTDESLAWSNAEYPDVEVLSATVDAIWTPDVALVNTFGKLNDIGQEGGFVNVNSKGKVTMWPYSAYKVPCKITIAKFPFDIQTCRFTYISWTKPSSVLSLRSESTKINMDQYSKSGQWEIVSGEAFYTRMVYTKDVWDYVNFELTLKRKSLYYVMNIMAPVLCICLLNVCCFLLPTEEGERVSLSISIFLTLAVFLTIVNSTMPESSDEVAQFGVYVGLQLFGNALTILVTTWSLNLFHRSEQQKVSKLYKQFVRTMRITHPVPDPTHTITTNINHSHQDSKRYELTSGQTGSLQKTHLQTFDNTPFNHVTMNNKVPRAQVADGMPTTEAKNRLSVHGEQDLPLELSPSVDVSKDVAVTVTAQLMHTERPPFMICEPLGSVTWKMVSLAVDRFCLIASICWHIVLLCVLMETAI